ncbi:MAG: hypothetical protein KDD64_14180, partial [Bdellovibrionales bacterium]|nr:hypothetical protein [Bdellovibrionales bacterium]
CPTRFAACEEPYNPLKIAKITQKSQGAERGGWPGSPRLKCNIFVTVIVFFVLMLLQLMIVILSQP